MTVRDRWMPRFLPYTFEVWPENEAWYLCVMDRDYCCMWITPLKGEPLRKALERATWNGDMSRDGHRKGGKQGWLYDSTLSSGSSAWDEYTARVDVLMSLKADSDGIELTAARHTDRRSRSHKAWHKALGLAYP